MALRGVKVLEFAGLAPAPFCGMILADFGASVLKIDKIDSNANLDCLSNGKKSIALNLKHPHGIKIIKQLVRKSDVLIEPFRAGVMEKLGLGSDTLMGENPQLIYARLSGYGQKGPFASTAGHDINYLSLSGLLSLFGRKDEKPLFPVNYGADFAGGGLICALGIVMALYERRASGLGQVIDSNMVEGAAYVGSWLYRSQSLPIWGRERGANVLDTGAHFYEVYETKDGQFMAVGALEGQFYQKLLRGLGVGSDEAPHFGDFEKLKVLFAEKFRERSQEEWCRIFDGVDACVTPVLSLEGAPKHKHNLEREAFENGVPKPAPRLSRTPGLTNVGRKAPQIGEHSKVVLGDLGYSDGDIGGLIDDGVVECYEKSKL